ncbi:MAG: hypothetical protein AAFQ94_13715 [Bacteroidota bacterium]
MCRKTEDSILVLSLVLSIVLSLFSCKPGKPAEGDTKADYSIFYPDTISSQEFSENSISFTKDEDYLFITRTKDWNNQSGYLSKRVNGKYATAQPIKPLDTIYNGAISPSGNRIIFCKKENQKEEIYLLSKQDDSWCCIENLSDTSNIYGGYFDWVSDEELYFYSPFNNGDILQARLNNGLLTIIDSLQTLNTEKGTEFSPFVDYENNYLIFTRYLEGAISQQGFFVSFYTSNDIKATWSMPQKISFLSYGWNPAINKTESLFLYTDGDDIIKIPLERFYSEINKLKKTSASEKLISQSPEDGESDRRKHQN